MSQYLRIKADLDMYEKAERERLALQTRYEIAISIGDELDQRRVAALISDWELRHPGYPVLDPAA